MYRFAFKLLSFCSHYIQTYFSLLHPCPRPRPRQRGRRRLLSLPLRPRRQRQRRHSTMNVSDLLQDSPSQHRKRPTSTSTSSSSPVPQQIVKSNSVSPQTNAAQPRPTLPHPNAQYPAPPSYPGYSPSSPFVPQRITPRQPPEQPMASLQHPHPHNSWGPRSSSGSSTLLSATTRAPLPVGPFFFSFHPHVNTHFHSFNEIYRKKSSSSTTKRNQPCNYCSRFVFLHTYITTLTPR